MPPVLVHTARTLALAEMLKDLLLQQGIEAAVAPAGRPYIGWLEPVDATEVWIANEDDLERARGIVVEFENGPSQPGTGWSWRCKGCGEVVEGQFTECWKCGASRR